MRRLDWAEMIYSLAPFGRSAAGAGFAIDLEIDGTAKRR